MPISVYAKTPLQDPTRPPSFSAPDLASSPSELTLYGIFDYPTHRIAIINGMRVFVGDKLGEYIVTAIDRNTVELSKSKNETLVLSLVPQVKTKLE